MTFQSLEAEQSVIGSIFIDCEKVMPMVLDTLSADDFLIAENRTIIQAIFDLYSDSKPIDAVSILHKVGNEYRMYLLTCMEITPTAQNAGYYINVVRECSQRQKAFEKCEQLFRSMSEKADVSELSQTAMDVASLLEPKRKNNIVTAKQAATRFLDRMSKTEEYIRTGLGSLDKFCYLSPGMFVIIGARPSVGKTAFAINLMSGICKSKRCVFFSLETDADRITDRIIAADVLLNHTKIKERNFTDTDYEKIAAGTMNISKGDFIIVEAAGWTADQITAKAKQLKADVVFIDYLGLVAGAQKEYERVTENSMKLHIFAQREKILTFALSQLNREQEHRGKSSEPTMADLRSSGQIEQDADVIILLHRQDSEDGTSKYSYILAKNKDGAANKKVNVHFQAETQKFTDLVYGR